MVEFEKNLIKSLIIYPILFLKGGKMNGKKNSRRKGNRETDKSIEG